MNLFRYILLSIIISSYIYTEEITVIEYSNSFTIDTKLPNIEITSPNHGDNYGPNDNIALTWSASDDSPVNNPMKVNVSAFLDEPYLELLSSFPNTGSLSLPVPDHINTIFASIRLDIVDYYGNKSYAYTDGYFTIGSPDLNNYAVMQDQTSSNSISSNFIIDTKSPQVEWRYPNEQTSFNPNQGQVVRWEASDESLGNNSISLSFIDSGVTSYSLVDNIPNNGIRFINLPDIVTSLGQFEVTATDIYGNSTFDRSDNYMTIGNAGSTQVQEESIADTSYSISFTIDTKPPSFMPIETNINGDGAYFYPNGGEILNDFSAIQLDWDCDDESFENGQVRVSLAYLLGGWYVDIGTFPTNSLYASASDFSLNGLVNETIWARLLFTAIDDYGNTNSQYNDDYFVLGDGEGDLDVNWVDQDNDEIMLNWSWEEKHTVMIKRSAMANVLGPGDLITIVDTSGVHSGLCTDANSYIELKEITINDNNSIGGPKSILKGINHCDQGGGRRTGFTEGSPIIFKVTRVSDSQVAYVKPNLNTLIGSQNFTSGGYTIVKDFDYDNPISITNRNNSISNDDRDYDSFNVYNKVNAIRNCDNPGTGDNEGWCYDTTIIGETDYLTQVPNLLESSMVSYRVWLLDNSDNEIFKTVDTEFEVEVQLSDIYDKSLSTGWNWFSINKYIDDMSLNNVMSSLTTTNTLVDGDYIKSYTGFSDYYAGFGWFGTGLDNFDNSSMYKINLTTNSGNITFEGNAVVPSESPININSGWNWIGYTPNEVLDIDTALSSIYDQASNGDYIKSFSGFADFYEGFGWFGTGLSTLNPKEGYMLDFANTDVLLYPDPVSLRSDIEIRNSTYNKKWDLYHRDFEYNGSLTIGLDKKISNVTENDQIAAFHKNECRGITKAITCPLNNKIVFPIMLYSNNDNEEFTFKYYNSLNDEVIELSNKVIFYKDMHLNNALEPYIMSNELPIAYSLENAYPNPFNPSTNIKFSLAEDVNDLKLYIYDITGRLVKKLHQGSKERGEYEIKWNATNYASGIYFISLKTNNYSSVKKIMLIK